MLSNKRRGHFASVGGDIQAVIAAFPKERLRTEEQIAQLEAEAERERQEERKPLLVDAFRNGLPLEYTEMVNEPVPDHPGVRRAHAVANTLEPGEHLFLYGTSGNAKTHLAIRTGVRLIRAHSLGVRFYTWPGYLDRYRNFESTEERPRPMEHDVLILDELDKGNDSDWVYERLYEVLQRQVHRKTIIVLSNHPPLVTASMYGRGDERNQEAIVSRLSRFIAVEVTGKDHRPHQKRGQTKG